MSHIANIKTQIRDPVALAAACVRLGLQQPTQGKAKLFSAEAEGLIVQLPGWTFPAVVDTTSGSVAFDNYNGSWGDPKELDRLMQGYAVEKARIEARKAGHNITEQALADGSIKLTISVERWRIMKTIEIIISPTGEPTIQTKGFAGASCRDASPLIERALGQVQSD